MALLYANENFPLPVVESRRRRGHGVVTVQETNSPGQIMSDPEVLAFARARNWTVLTLNRKHFIRLHSQSGDHAGIIACTFDPDFNRQAERIHAAIETEGLLSGKLIRVNRPNNPEPSLAVIQ